jgi:putative membrane protein
MASSQPLILIVGFTRAISPRKVGPIARHNVFFWAKIGTFIVIGLLAVPPTLAFLKWRRAGASPTHEAVAKVRTCLWIQVALFPLLLAFAAAMARGYGEF